MLNGARPMWAGWVTMGPTKVGQKSEMQSPRCRGERGRSYLPTINMGRTTMHACVFETTSQFLLQTMIRHPFPASSCGCDISVTPQITRTQICLSPPIHRQSSCVKAWCVSTYRLWLLNAQKKKYDVYQRTMAEPSTIKRDSYESIDWTDNSCNRW